jgi:hypothetical protein
MQNVVSSAVKFGTWQQLLHVCSRIGSYFRRNFDCSKRTRMALWLVTWSPPYPSLLAWSSRA